MLNVRIACALLALTIALYSATVVVAVKINLVVAVLCIAVVAALLNTLWNTAARRRPEP
jgi:hypothetical protein